MEDKRQEVIDKYGADEFMRHRLKMAAMVREERRQKELDGWKHTKEWVDSIYHPERVPYLAEYRELVAKKAAQKEAAQRGE